MGIGGAIILAGTAVVVTAVWLDAGFSAAAAVVALVGWLRSEACFRGAYRRLESAALDLEASELARNDLQAKMDALPLVHLHLTGGEQPATESARTIH